MIGEKKRIHLKLSSLLKLPACLCKNSLPLTKKKLYLELTKKKTTAGLKQLVAKLETFLDIAVATCSSDLNKFHPVLSHP